MVLVDFEVILSILSSSRISFALCSAPCGVSFGKTPNLIRFTNVPIKDIIVIAAHLSLSRPSQRNNLFLPGPASYASEGTLAVVTWSGEIHLEQQCASEALLTGVVSKGEFHAIIESASEALLARVASTREIHLERQCASEGILKGVSPKGEFHETALAASGVLLTGVARCREIYL